VWGERSVEGGSQRIQVSNGGEAVHTMHRLMFFAVPVLLVVVACALDGNNSSTATTTPATTATAVVSPITSWGMYSDAAAGFNMPIPENTVRNEGTVELPAKNGYSAVQQRLISFVNQDGAGVVGVGVTPNPSALSLEDWIRTYPGWPSDPTSLTIAGAPGLRFSRNVLDEPADFVFFQHAGYIFELSGGVYGSPEGGYGPTITRADFDHVIDQFRFNQ
jgi:hypothetical protein